MSGRSAGRTVVYSSKKTSSPASSTPVTTTQPPIPNPATSEEKGYSLVYDKYGDPSVVLQREEFSIPTELKGQEVLVEILAAPINPSDLLGVQGHYEVKPPLPAIAGYEGVGKIIKMGSNVANLEVGDWVIPTAVETTGTWRTHAVWKEDNLTKIPNDIPMLAAATIAINPPTAYRMLHDFVQLQPGDVVIQNGANSGVGEAVIQIAHYLGVITVNVVRSRPDIEELKQHLKGLGADYVVTEEELRSEEFINSLTAKPKLALDCVGGQSSSNLLDTLACKGTMVTYGAMSHQPMMVPATNLIFKDIHVRGFWVTQWRKEHSHSQEPKDMTEHLCKMYREGKLATPQFVEMPLDDYKTAVQKAMAGFKGVKLIFVNKAD